MRLGGAAQTRPTPYFSLIRHVAACCCSSDGCSRGGASIRAQTAAAAPRRSLLRRFWASPAEARADQSSRSQITWVPTAGSHQPTSFRGAGFDFTPSLARFLVRAHLSCTNRDGRQPPKRPFPKLLCSSRQNEAPAEMNRYAGAREQGGGGEMGVGGLSEVRKTR